MKSGWKLVVFLLLGCAGVVGVSLGRAWTRIERIEAQPEAGFHWPYYLYVPEAARHKAEFGGRMWLLVLPDDGARLEDDLDAQQRVAWLRIAREMRHVDELGLPALVPAFPRLAEHRRIDTRSLDRDSLTCDVEGLERVDLQLIAMIEHATAELARRGITLEPKVVLEGFGASGAFVNRFTMLHPTRVRAAVAGAPEGWPLAPIATFGGQPLRYPLGTADLEEIKGEAFDAESFMRVPMLLYMGEADTYDAATRGAYAPRERDLLFELFGLTPLERWPTAQEIYAQAGCRAEFRLYPGLGRTPSADVRADTAEFLHAAVGNALP